jgi:hypothetical protein
VQKADLQPTGGANPNHVAVDETLILLNKDRYGCMLLLIPTPTLLHIRLSDENHGDHLDVSL